MISKAISKVNHCKSVSEIRKSPSGFMFSIFDSIDFVPESSWNEIVPEENILMRHAYLRAIESSTKDLQQSKYVLIYRNKELVGAALFNITYLFGKDLSLINSFQNCPINLLKNVIKDRAKIRILICGHTHISGSHGFIYSNSISSNEAYHALGEVMHQIQILEKKRGEIHLQLIKDFYSEEEVKASFLKNFKYKKFQVDPNMILKINPEWNQFDDYLQAMKTKYRKIAKTSFSKGSKLEKIQFEYSQIVEYAAKINELSTNVLSKAKFKMNQMDAHYFIELKKNLGKDFEFVGYFFEDKLVGFSTRIFWGNNCEAHAIGLDYESNSKFDLYLNILYDHVKCSIYRQNSKLILGRTAMEMKSNIGAEPEEMYCYIRHSENIWNHIMKPFLNRIKQPEWIQRKPFKELSY